MAIEYKLKIECSDLQAEVLLNGLPAFIQTGGMKTKTAIVNQWLVDERNKIEVRINAVENIDPATVSAYIALTLSENDDSLYNFNWKPSDADRPLPHVSRREFVSKNEFGEWAWQRADLLVLDETTINEINRFVQRIHNALNTANLAETMLLFRLKAEEQAIAYGLAIDDRINQQRRFFEEWFRQPGWGMQPIDYDFLEYRLYAGNRVVFVQYKDGSDVLSSKAVGDGEMVGFPLFISKIDGQWKIVR